MLQPHEVIYDRLLLFWFKIRAFLSKTPPSPRKSAGFIFLFLSLPQVPFALLTTPVATSLSPAARAKNTLRRWLAAQQMPILLSKPLIVPTRWLLSFWFNDRAFLSNTPLSPRKSRGLVIFFAFSPGFACGFTRGYCSVARRGGLYARLATIAGNCPSSSNFPVSPPVSAYRREAGRKEGVSPNSKPEKSNFIPTTEKKRNMAQ